MESDRPRNMIGFSQEGALSVLQLMMTLSEVVNPSLVASLLGLGREERNRFVDVAQRDPYLDVDPAHTIAPGG